MEVIALLDREGAPAAEPATAPSPLKRKLKQTLYLFLALVGVTFLMLVADGDPDAPISIFMLGLVGLLLRAIYVFVAERVRARRRKKARPEAHEAGLLTPGETSPVAIPKRRFDTGEIVPELPSVTEHTTRHLEERTVRRKSRSSS
jgi:hypothetical protein